MRTRLSTVACLLSSLTGMHSVAAGDARLGLPMFAVWDIKYTKRPVIARGFLHNRTVLCAAWIGFFDFVRLFFPVLDDPRSGS